MSRERGRAQLLVTGSGGKLTARSARSAGHWVWRATDSQVFPICWSLGLEGHWQRGLPDLLVTGSGGPLAARSARSAGHWVWRATASTICPIGWTQRLEGTDSEVCQIYQSLGVEGGGEVCPM